ncbi:hypothetical protein ABFS82_06G086900 [Erythranthe guttata]
MDSSNCRICSYWNKDCHTVTHDLIRWKSGKLVDPEILMLLESFEELYMDRREFFKKIFRGNHEELFKKIGDAVTKKKKMKKAKSMPRSMSMRAIGTRGLDLDDGMIDGIKLGRFKVRTPNVLVDEPEDMT